MMRQIANSRDRIKARVVGVGRDGDELKLVVPKPDKFISIKWHVLGDYFKWGVVLAGVFLCGAIFGAMWMTG